MAAKATAKTPTISLCMIVKELGPGLWECLNSVEKYVDEVNIVVANEDEEPGEWPKGGKRRFFKYLWHDDFAAARNFSFQQATKDWILWLDDDDVVQGGENLGKALNDAEERGIAKLHMMYHYRHDADGRPIVIQQRERLMKRGLGWKWYDRVHEYCASTEPHSIGLVDDVVVVHKAEAANTERNLRLLYLMLGEDPLNERVLLALADTYQSMKDWEQSLEYGERALEVCTNPDARWTLLTEMARTNQALQRWDEVERWCMTAVAYQPEYSLPYLLLAHMAWFGYQDAQRALFWLKEADDKAEAPTIIFSQPEDYTLRRWDVEHRAVAADGRWREALSLVDHAIKLAPTGDRDKWRYHQWHYLERTNMERSIQAAFDIVDHLCRRGDTLKAYDILTKNLPVSIQEDSRVLALTQRVRGFVEHVYDPAKYQQFYELGHSSPTEQNNLMNAIEVEKYRMDPLIERLRKRGAKRILDVGCGAGEPALYLAEAGFFVTGLDVNEHAVKEARKRATDKYGFKFNPQKPQFTVGTLETIGKEDFGTFDAVVMMEVIEHVHPSKAPLYLGSCEDLLNPGGAVFLTTPAMYVGDIPGVNQEFPRDHVKEFTRAELEGLLVQPLSRRIRRPQSLYRIFDHEVPVPGFATWFFEYDFFHADNDPQPEEWSKPISIYVGPGLEPWDPSTPDEVGLGGSETWAAKMARELRAKGHPVVVYAEASGVWEGVIYRHHSLFNPAAPFLGERAWLCLISRQTALLDVRPNADIVHFVAHDVDYGEELTPERIANIDSYDVMSNWQARHTMETYPDGRLGGHRMSLLANGIEPSFFEGKEERQRHRFIWSSSPDRGLDVLLGWWPEILEIWPDAELHIFYGFNNIDALADGRPWLVPFKAKIESLARQKGVVWHGRVGQKALAREFMKSQFWLYPSTDAFGEPWHETFCITALEAQAAGCIPIFPAVGALPERLEYGYMSPNEQLDLPTVLEALQSWDRNGPLSALHDAGWLNEVSWTEAAERLLSIVTPLVPAPEGETSAAAS